MPWSKQCGKTDSATKKFDGYWGATINIRDLS